MRKALLFDCDGVLVDTERDGHRIAFNAAFRELGIDVEWDVARYGALLSVAGGKERMRAYFDRAGWPVGEGDRDALIAALHGAKSRIFLDMVRSGAMPLRSGITRIVDEARAAKMKLGVCSTSKLESVQGCIDLMGEKRARAFDIVLAGDVVTRKKPDPAIYNLAAERLGLAPYACVVIEDSALGCAAAVAAGMRCVVTTSAYTEEEEFPGAYKVVSELGDGAGAVRLADIIQ
jgi:HAD superfamily hydrolase (TIGR01509 family)